MDDSQDGLSMNGSSLNNWCLIESDPGVFTDLVSRLGVTGIQFEEIYSLDIDSFQDLATNFGVVYGIIFLFKWTGTASSASDVLINPPNDLFFAKQVITNACATQAILSILLNHSNRIALGPELEGLKEFTENFDSFMKGLTLSNSHILRSAHNYFKSQSPFELIHTDDTDEDKEAFHFVSYVPFGNHVYELDGLQEGPICVGTLSHPLDQMPPKNWLDIVRIELTRRVAQIQQQNFPSNSTNFLNNQCNQESAEIRFNVMAVIEDQTIRYKKQLNDLRRRRLANTIQLMSFGEDIDIDPLDAESSEGTEELLEQPPMNEDISITSLQFAISTLTLKIKELMDLIDADCLKKHKWTLENKRRRHDFIPFILCALRHLAKTGALKNKYQKIILEANTC